MEAVTHHAMAKQKKDDCQDDYKQELSNSERGRLSSGRVGVFKEVVIRSASPPG
jgi:hypothetical protein